MKSDLYTKAMLTIIAACLMWMSLGGPSLMAGVSAQAQNAKQAEKPTIQQVKIVNDLTDYIGTVVVTNSVTRTPHEGIKTTPLVVKVQE